MMEKSRAEYKRKWRARKRMEKYGEYVGNLRGRHGNHAKGPRNGRWNKGKLISSDGYVLVRVDLNDPKGFGVGKNFKYRYEHDLIMENTIGRPLKDGEVVHHKNEIKTDNDPNNLELTTPSLHMTEHNRRKERNVQGRFKPTIR